VPACGSFADESAWKTCLVFADRKTVSVGMDAGGCFVNCSATGNNILANRSAARKSAERSVQSLPEPKWNPLPPWDTIASGSFFARPASRGRARGSEVQDRALATGCCLRRRDRLTRSTSSTPIGPIRRIGLIGLIRPKKMRGPLQITKVLHGSLCNTCGARNACSCAARLQRQHLG